MISAVVLTNNSEKSLTKTLKSVSFCQEILIIDDDSTDKTLTIAKKFKTRIFKRKLKADFSSQRNFGLKKARHDWILFVDSDEIVLKKFKREILNEIGENKGEIQGYVFKRWDLFLGKRLKWGEAGGVRLLRLAIKNAGTWKGRVHEVWQVKGRIKTLANPLLHDREMSISLFLKRLNWYAKLRAKELFKQGKKESFFRLFVNPMTKFFYNYLFRLGFLDGVPGLAMAFFMSWHSLLVRVWLALLWENHGREDFLKYQND